MDSALVFGTKGCRLVSNPLIAFVQAATVFEVPLPLFIAYLPVDHPVIIMSHFVERFSGVALHHSNSLNCRPTTNFHCCKETS